MIRLSRALETIRYDAPRPVLSALRFFAAPVPFLCCCFVTGIAATYSFSFTSFALPHSHLLLWLQCDEAYTGDRCAICSLRHYRMNGECIKCPDNAWMLIVGLLLAVVVLAGVGYILHKKQMVRTGAYFVRPFLHCALMCGRTVSL